MDDQNAFSSRQRAWPVDVGRVPPRRRESSRHPGLGTAIIGLLLASGAGVYTYRQFVEPVPDAEDTAPDAAPVAIPRPGFDQLAPLREIAEPMETAVAVAPASRPVPQEQKDVAGPASLPRSSDEAFHAVRPRAVAAFSGTSPSSGPEQPAAEMDGGIPSSTPPNAEPPLLEATFADSGTLPHGPSMELGPKIDEMAGSPSLLAAASSKENPSQESYARAEPASDADVQPSAITSPDVEPSSMAQLADAEPSSSEAVAGDEIQIASEPQFPIGDRPAGLSGNTAGESPGAIHEIEPSAALAAATSKEADDERPERVPMLAKRSTDEIIIAAKPAEDQPRFVPARPIPAPPVSAALTEGSSSSADYVQRFPMVFLNGTPLGAITLREFEGNQRMIHLGALLSLFRSRMDPAEFERLISAGSADQFVSLDELGRAGLDAQYDIRRERLIIGVHSGPIDE